MNSEAQRKFRDGVSDVASSFGVLGGSGAAPDLYSLLYEPRVMALAAGISRIPIRFVLEDARQAHGELVRFQAPKTADALLRRLPLEGRIARWKEEIYFEAGITMGPEKAKSKVDSGTIAFWPMGSAICVFYGQTQPYSPVNVLGIVKNGIEIFRDVPVGTKIKMEKS